VITRIKDAVPQKIRKEQNKFFYLNLYNRLSKIIIYSIFLVICAGGFVRMTGSGMGCPDWPKCFGYWIPPTDISDLPINYKEIYAHRGYDQLDFNVFNTWTEYINRLLGVVSGLLCLLLLGLSFLVRDKLLMLLSFILLIIMGVQGWLGAVVVYSVLAPFKITIHMLIAVLIIALVSLLFKISSPQPYIHVLYNKWILGGVILSIIQIVLGTQVRENVDTYMHLYDRLTIISQLPVVFEIHRIIAWLVFIINSLILYYHRQYWYDFHELKYILLIMVILFITGFIMTYFDLPGIAQLLHLVCAVALFIAQFSLLLRGYRLSIVNSP